jgi:hypothetical protein
MLGENSLAYLAENAPDVGKVGAALLLADRRPIAKPHRGATDGPDAHGAAALLTSLQR